MTDIDQSFDETLTWHKKVGYPGFANAWNPKPARANPPRGFSWNPGGAGPTFTLPGVPTSSGVYALYYDNAVNYVGQAVNLAHRLGDHYIEVFQSCSDDVLGHIKYYYATTNSMYINEMEAILIRLARVTNAATRNVQNAQPGSLTITYGVVAALRNDGKLPNFVKHPGAGNLCPGGTQPRVYVPAAAGGGWHRVK